MTTHSAEERQATNVRRFACSVQPHLPAAAYCTECRRPYAGRFLSVLQDGRAVCYRCVTDQRLKTVADEEESVVGDPAFANGWFGAISGVIRDPRRFLGTKAYTGSVKPALRFGFVMCLAGAVLPLVFPAIFAPETLNEAWQKAYGQAEVQLTPAQLRMAFLTALPVAAALKLLVGSALFHVGIRLAGAREGMFREHFRVFALSTGVLLFAIVPPPLGLMIMSLLWGNAMMKWTGARYGLSPMMSMIAVFPALLLLVIL